MSTVAKHNCHLTTQRLTSAETASLERLPGAGRRVDEAVRRRMATCPYRYVFNKINWQFDDGKLTLSGCVPSFHLKQMLQELLRNIDGVKDIANDVDVVSSSGLSSERRRMNSDERR